MIWPVAGGIGILRGPGITPATLNNYSQSNVDPGTTPPAGYTSFGIGTATNTRATGLILVLAGMPSAAADAFQGLPVTFSTQNQTMSQLCSGYDGVNNQDMAMYGLVNPYNGNSTNIQYFNIASTYQSFTAGTQFYMTAFLFNKTNLNAAFAFPAGNLISETYFGPGASMTIPGGSANAITIAACMAPSAGGAPTYPINQTLNTGGFNYPSQVHVVTTQVGAASSVSTFTYPQNGYGVMGQAVISP